MGIAKGYSTWRWKSTGDGTACGAGISGSRPGSVLFLLLILALAAASYLPALNSPFHYDDVTAILENPGIRLEGWSLEAWGGILRGSPPSLKNRPLVQILYTLMYRAWGLEASYWRGVNISLHLLNILLVYRLGFHILLSLKPDGAIWGGLAGAALWGLHPVHTQAVTYIVQGLTVLSATFSLLAFECFFRTRREVRSAWIWWGPWLVAFLLALACKENAAVVPFLTFLLATVVPVRPFGGGSGSVLKKILPVVLLLLYVAMAAAFYLHGGEVLREGYAAKGFTPWQRILTQPRVLGLYLSLLALPLPSRLSIDRDYAVSAGFLSPMSTALCWLALAVAIGAAVAMRRRRPGLALAVFWFLVALSLESSIIPLDLVYEHRLYLPAAIPLILLGHAAVCLGREPRRSAADVGARRAHP